MKKILDILNQGVYDPGIFKAVFMAGGPGSGKSTMANIVLPKYVSGLKSINSDEVLQFISKKTKQTLNIAGLDPQSPEMMTFLKNRQSAKNISDNKLKMLINGRIGLLIDGTGKDVQKIKKQKEKLQGLGYQCAMLFINTSLEVAQQRNLKRQRKLKDELVKQLWNQVQSNIGAFQSLFGRQHFYVIDNNDMDDNVLQMMTKKLSQFVSKPVENYIAKMWIDKQLQSKNTLKKQGKSDYVIYHNSLTDCIKQMQKYVKRFGYTLNDDEMFDQVGNGPKKPSQGKTNKYHLHLYKDDKVTKKLIHFQVYGMKDRYQLNMYIG